MSREEHDQLIKALLNFLESYEILRDLWTENDVMNNLRAIELYPFDCSFDELEVVPWAQATIKELLK